MEQQDIAHQIAHKPREIADCVSAYLQDGNLEGIVSMFHPDCLVFFPLDAPPHVGLEGAREAFKAFIEVRPKIESNVFSEIITGDTAMLRANWRVVAPDGSVMATGQSTEVAKKLPNGGWGYLIDCPNGPPNNVGHD
ncbi:MAG: nuclear transport factor 2 family protein [Parasphingorhabdus sp.]